MSLVKEDDLVYRLHKRAEIRKQITTRKSVQNNEPDRIEITLIMKYADGAIPVMTKLSSPAPSSAPTE